jgi:hypothetical protein
MTTYEPLINGTPFKDLVECELSNGWNEAYKLHSGLVLHLYQNVDITDPSTAMATRRYFSQGKGSLISEFICSLPDYEGISLPEVTSYGEVNENGLNLGYWQQTYLPGIPFVEANDISTVVDYGNILDWAACVHQQAHLGSVNLAEYYEQRRQSLLISISNFAPNPIERLKILSSAIEYWKILAEDSIDVDEVTTRVHGDLNNGNILFKTKSSISEPQGYSVIDFEWGSVESGDLIVDAQKLLRLDFDFFSTPPGKHMPRLSLDQKLDLLFKHLEYHGDYVNLRDAATLKRRLLLTILEAHITRLACEVVWTNHVRRPIPLRVQSKNTLQTLVNICADIQILID